MEISKRFARIFGQMKDFAFQDNQGTAITSPPSVVKSLLAAFTADVSLSHTSLLITSSSQVPFKARSTRNLSNLQLNKAVERMFP